MKRTFETPWKPPSIPERKARSVCEKHPKIAPPRREESFFAPFLIYSIPSENSIDPRKSFFHSFFNAKTIGPLLLEELLIRGFKSSGTLKTQYSLYFEYAPPYRISANQRRPHILFVEGKFRGFSVFFMECVFLIWRHAVPWKYQQLIFVVFFCEKKLFRVFCGFCWILTYVILFSFSFRMKRNRKTSWDCFRNETDSSF